MIIGSSDATGDKFETLRPCEKIVVQDVEVQMDQEEEFGTRNPRKLPDPKLPSKDEVEKHYLTHLPFRNWCEYCIKARARLHRTSSRRSVTMGCQKFTSITVL